MSKGQALRSDFAARSVIGFGANSEVKNQDIISVTHPTESAPKRHIPKTPAEVAYAEQLMDEEIYLKTIEWMLIVIKGQISIRLALGKPDLLELPRRLKQTLNELFPDL